MCRFKLNKNSGEPGQRRLCFTQQDGSVHILTNLFSLCISGNIKYFKSTCKFGGALSSVFLFSLFIVAKVWRRWKEKGWPEAQRKKPEQHQLHSSSLLIWNWKLLNCPLVPLSTSLSAITPPSVFIPQTMMDTDVWSRTLLTLITLAFFFLHQVQQLFF